MVIIRSILFVVPMLLVSCTALATGTPEPTETLSVRQTAERLTSNDIANLIGQGALEPVCEELSNPVHGATFKCSAQASDNRVVFLSGKVEIDGRISLVTTNVVLASDLPEIEKVAVVYVNQRLQGNYPPNTLTCGESSIILNTQKVIACSFIEPGSGDIFDAEVRIDDLANKKVTVRIAGQPRA